MSKTERRRRRNRLTVFQYIKTAAAKKRELLVLCAYRDRDNKPGVQMLLRRKNFLMAKKVVSCWH